MGMNQISFLLLLRFEAERERGDGKAVGAFAPYQRAMLPQITPARDVFQMALLKFKKRIWQCLKTVFG